MNKNNEFGQGILYSITSNIYGIMVTNLYFLISNIPLLLAILFLIPSFSNAILYLIAALPMGPSISALIGCMIKLHESKDLSVTRDYLKLYKNNFKDSLMIWVPISIILLILLTDIQYLIYTNLNYKFIYILFIAMISIIFLIVAVNMLIINVKFKFRFIDLIKISLICSIKNLKISIGNICLLFLTIFFMYITTDFIIMFISSILAFLIVINSYDLIKEIKKEYVKE